MHGSHPHQTQHRLGLPQAFGRLTPVQIISIDMDRGMIEAPFIDAEEGTPVIDIKPYHPSLDRMQERAFADSHWFSAVTASIDS